MHDEPPTRRRLQASSGAKSVGHLSQRDEELWCAMTSEDYNPRMESTLSFLTLLTSGLFAGAALYVTAVEHPARMSQGASIALQEFRHSFRRAAPLQAALAVICFLCSLVVWRLTGQWAWLAGGVSVGTVVPFTFAFIMTTNRLLLDAASPLKDDEALVLLAKWARLHAVRTYLGLLGFAILLAQSFQQARSH